MAQSEGTIAVSECFWPSQVQYDEHTSHASTSASTVHAHGNKASQFSEHVEATMAQLPFHLAFKIRILLWLLTIRLGTFFLVGPICFTRRFPFVTAFVNLPLGRKEAIIRRMLLHRLPNLRVGFRALRALVGYMSWTQPGFPGRAEHDRLASQIGYSGRAVSPIPLAGTRNTEEVAVERALVTDLAQHRSTAASCSADAHACQDQPDAEDLVRLLTANGIRAWRASAVDAAVAGCQDLGVAVSCDAVVIGSGAGGGPAAAVLTRAGLAVVVVEKGSYTPAGSIPRGDGDALKLALDHAGLACTDDTGIAVLSGSCLGGGTRINWCASLRTPDHVRTEWATEHGLLLVQGRAFDDALDAVCSRLQVHHQPDVSRNFSAAALRAGYKALGKSFTNMPQNCVHPNRCSVHCCVGCKPGGKQDSVRTWLADAARYSSRFSILTGCHVDKLTFSRAPSPHGKERQVTGALTRLSNGVAIHIRARAIISAAGALHTPALLLRSGISSNGNVGRNLRLHPGTVALGFFADSSATLDSAMEGPIMPLYSSCCAHWDEPEVLDKYGAMLSTASALPATVLGMLPYQSSSQYKQDCSNASNMACGLVYTRDWDCGGRVTLNRKGQPLLRYRTARRTQAHMLEGVCVQLRALRAAGATRLLTLHSDFSAFDVGDATSDEAFEEWLTRVHAKGADPTRLQTLSAHQMGTARMGDNPRTSVTNTDGQVWGVKGLWIADASLFPTASGVNPMVTVSALALLVAQNVASELAGPQSVPLLSACTSTLENDTNW